MMWSVVYILLLTGTYVVATDFDIISGSYEFIYHENQELLLTIHDRKCYHSHIRDFNCPEMLETQIEMQIRYDEHIKHSSLENLRNTFEDLLANFHCLDKDVYKLDIDSDFSCSEIPGHNGD